jgi:hypothetical protein
MNNSEKIYQSILNQLSLVPVDYLQQVETFLQKLTRDIQRKQQNRALILGLAGSWTDMPEDDFNEYLGAAKKTGSELFNREIDL